MEAAALSSYAVSPSPPPPLRPPTPSSPFVCGFQQGGGGEGDTARASLCLHVALYAGQQPCRLIPPDECRQSAAPPQGFRRAPPRGGQALRGPDSLPASGDGHPPVGCSPQPVVRALIADRCHRALGRDGHCRRAGADTDRTRGLAGPCPDAPAETLASALTYLGPPQATNTCFHLFLTGDNPRYERGPIYPFQVFPALRNRPDRGRPSPLVQKVQKVQFALFELCGLETRDGRGKGVPPRPKSVCLVQSP